MEKVCILIPAYNPDEKLSILVNQLKDLLPQVRIFVVNDGSDNDEIFKKLCVEKVLTHSQNLGKGEALKNGFKYISDNVLDCKGVVTADCDLQHCVDDITKIVCEISEQPNLLYLGSRVFEKGKVPFRSFIGNVLMSKFLKFTCKIDVKDTQTGLRGIPFSFLKHLLMIEVSDFSFETEMLIQAEKCNIPIKEIPIQTIYIENNKSSHFRPFKDSYRILKTVMRSAK